MDKESSRKKGGSKNEALKMHTSPGWCGLGD